MAVSNRSKTSKSGQKRNTVSISVDDADLRKLLYAFKDMDDIAKNDMKKFARDLSIQAANQVERMASRTRQGAAVARSIKLNPGDKAPSFSLGGNSDASVRGGAKFGELLFGVEFGASGTKLNGQRGALYFSNGGRRFPNRSPKEGNGNAGYFIFPTLKRMQPEITRAWLEGYAMMRKAWKGRN